MGGRGRDITSVSTTDEEETPEIHCAPPSTPLSLPLFAVTHLWMAWQTLTPTHPFTAPQPLVLLTLVLLRTPVHTYQLTCWRTRGLRGWAELAAKQQISDITVIHDVVVMYFIHILFSKDFWVISLRPGCSNYTCLAAKKRQDPLLESILNDPNFEAIKRVSVFSSHFCKRYNYVVLGESNKKL